MNQSIAFIGLGNMGMPMARNLLRANFSLYVFNRSCEKSTVLVKEGAQLISSPLEAFQKASIVITMLANDAVLEEITFGPKGLLGSIKEGCIHLSMSTISPDTSRNLEKMHREKNAYFVSAPVFGRPDVAAQAKLWICLSGDEKPKKQVMPILKLLGQRIEDFGDNPGNANVVKLAGNFLILSAIESIGEALSLAEKNGLDKMKIASFFGETLFPSPVYQTYGKLIANAAFDPPGFKMHLGFKDINLVQDAASASHVFMPIAKELQRLLKDGISQGRGELDWSAITLSAKNKKEHP